MYSMHLQLRTWKWISVKKKASLQICGNLNVFWIILVGKMMTHHWI